MPLAISSRRVDIWYPTAVKELSSGVLVRLTTCKRVTDSLPQLSLITLSPPETAGYQVGRIYGPAGYIYGRTCYLSKRFHFLGIYPGEYFSSSTWLGKI